MDVPTPPSTQEHTKIVYQGTIGATNYSFDASDVKPGQNILYTVTLGTSEYGKSLQKNMGYCLTNNTGAPIRGFEMAPESPIDTYSMIPGANAYIHGTPFVEDLGSSEPADTSNVYVQVDANGDNNPELVKYEDAVNYDLLENYSGNYYKWYDGSDGTEYDSTNCTNVESTTTNIPTKLDDDDLGKLYIKVGNDYRKATTDDVEVNNDGSYTLKQNEQYFMNDSNASDEINLPAEDDGSNGARIAGKNVMTLDYAKNNGFINDTQYYGYIEAINNANMTDSSGEETYDMDDFFLYIDDDNKVHFALKSDVNDNDGAANTYDFIPDGEFVRETEYNDCALIFDPSSGRITSIKIPNYDANGEVISYTEMNLKAVTETDEMSYQDAMAQYEYKQYLYDKTQQEINAKTEIIQQEDRNLELKLRRLDSERTQITTEIEALDKVIGDNIEGTYKTFSG